MNSSRKLISDLLKEKNNWLVSQTEQFTSGKFWWLKIFLLCLLFSILFSGGLDFGLRDSARYPEGYFKKIEHPLLDAPKIYGLNSHESALNFRLTVPVLLYLAGIHNHWSLPILTILAICSILLTSCIIAHRITGDRVCACFIALNVSATYVGSFGLIFCYDAIAIAQLALVGLPGLAWWCRGMLVFTASFTDERAFVASTLLLVGSFFFSGNQQSFSARIHNPSFLAIAGGMLAYGLARLALMKFVGLSSPTQGAGPGALVSNLTLLHPGVWFSLEGGWLFFLLTVGVLFAHRQFLTVTILVLVSLGYLGFAFMIGDLLRSTVYIFPLLFICLKVVRQNETLPTYRIFCLLAFLISALGGNYNVFLHKITWFQPLVVHWLQTGLTVLYEWVYPMLPHTMPYPTLLRPEVLGGFLIIMLPAMPTASRFAANGERNGFAMMHANSEFLQISCRRNNKL